MYSKINKYFLVFLVYGFSSLVFGLWSSPAFSAPLDEAYQDYIYGDYQGSVEKAKAIADDKSFYLAGLCYLKLDDNEKAREYFETVIMGSGSSVIKEKASISLADTYLLEENFPAAASRYEAVRAKNPQTTYLPLIYLRLAQIAGKQGRWSERNNYLRQLKEKFPNSIELVSARLIEGYGDFYTIQVGAFSSRPNAAKLEEEIRLKNYPSYIVEENISGQMFYKVRVGKYQSREQARKVFFELLDLGYPAKISP